MTQDNSMKLAIVFCCDITNLVTLLQGDSTKLPTAYI